MRDEGRDNKTSDALRMKGKGELTNIRSSERRIFKQATKKIRKGSAVAVNSRRIFLLMIAEVILHLRLCIFLAAYDF
jgi:hypothetical protein